MKRAKIASADGQDDVANAEDTVVAVSTETMKKYHAEHPRQLIPEICQLMYNLGWVTGTGGGMSMKYKSKIYIAPSGVQKERIRPVDLFVLNEEAKVLKEPIDKALTPSQCTPLFFNAYKMRGAGAVIHTHSQSAVLATLLWDKDFRITHQEMIKGIKRGWGANAETMNYYDELIVPIIENTPREEDLQEWMAKAMEEYPNANAVLVRFGFLKAHTFRIAYIVGRQYLANMKYDEFRRHGVYVWGPTWQKAKSMCECYDYLFEIAVKMKQLGIDPSVVPETSIYKHLVKSTK